MKKYREKNLIKVIYGIYLGLRFYLVNFDKVWNFVKVLKSDKKQQ
jgi:hypothetical protein